MRGDSVCLTMRLEGKVAIITGAAAGIGRASAVLFAQEGAQIAAVDLDGDGNEALASEIVKAGGRAAAMVGDVSQGADVRRIVGQTREHFGKVDILFNNAGIVPHGKIHETTEEE